MVSKKRKFGDLGEELACRYLKNKGYLVVGRNYLKPYGEIDIIGSRAGVIHFFEVKTVSRDLSKSVTHENIDYWNPAELIHPKKLERMHKAIGAYVAEHKLDMEWQVDGLIVQVDEAAKQSKVELIEGIS